jgi:hypothetical protein
LSSSRFRPFKHAHFINPVLYAEFENISGADKIMKEVEGHDVESDFLAPNEESVAHVDLILANEEVARIRTKVPSQGPG